MLWQQRVFSNGGIVSVPLTGVVLGGETSLLHVAAAICQELMETWSFGRFCLVGLSTHVVLKDGTNRLGPCYVL